MVLKYLCHDIYIVEHIITYVCSYLIIATFICSQEDPGMTLLLSSSPTADMQMISNDCCGVMLHLVLCHANLFCKVIYYYIAYSYGTTVLWEIWWYHQGTRNVVNESELAKICSSPLEMLTSFINSIFCYFAPHSSI